MTERDSTPIRRATTSTPKPASAATLYDDDVSWQQLILFNYVLFEALDAMQQEQASGNHTPINHHWQQFVYHLRLNRPTLGDCLDRLLADWEGLQ